MEGVAEMDYVFMMKLQEQLMFVRICPLIPYFLFSVFVSEVG
jgi:hypothetical protein